MIFRTKLTLQTHGGPRDYFQFVSCDCASTATVFAKSEATRLGYEVLRAVSDTLGRCVLPLDRDMGHGVRGSDWIPC